MTELQGPGPGTAPGRSDEIVCLHCNRVVLVANDRDELLASIAFHYATVHDLASAVLVDEVNFEIHPAPYRCDLCSSVVEPPYWTYVTPYYPVEDIEWLVCDPCAPLVDSRDAEGLVARAMSSWHEQSGISRQDIKEHLTPTMREIVSHFDPALTRRDLTEAP